MSGITRIRYANLQHVPNRVVLPKIEDLLSNLKGSSSYQIREDSKTRQNEPESEVSRQKEPQSEATHQNEITRQNELRNKVTRQDESRSERKKITR